MTPEQVEKAKASKRAYYERNKALVKARAKEWKAANAEKVKAGAKTYRDTHKAEMKALQDAWCAANPDRVRAKSKRHYKKHAERIRAKSRTYHHANRRLVAQKMQAYRQRPQYRAQATVYRERREKGLATGALSKTIVQTLMRMQRGRCACCKKPLGRDYHLDHRMPLVLGGLNVDENMQLLRARCNLEKHKKHPVDFMQQRGYLL